ncbi:LiaF-related protein [Lactobacillus hamsteri]|uniref:LiaF transmembrane domain-containing protein n=1 Tax=Lactobacillus hamsteri DSM 5661 = JCM 6256 TaxID=1423754 RepID=A0A0R1YF38_9LACO|nr:hypothetical protein [Lactobacillus hamsteri]KRM40913.1 hypothetical protein FC39_GL001557 [Lactobacillus hamsteri DSM 5661 = JCM 6256]
MKNRFWRSFWGIFFLAAAALVVVNQMGILTYKLGFWAIIGTIIFALSLIDGLINRRITESVFSVAFLLMIFAQPLHITKLVPWTILLAAVLISIGLGIIFRNRFHTVVYANKKIKDFRNKRESISDHIFTDTVSNENGAHVVIDQTMSDTSRYIHSKELETIDVRGKMGDINIYLDDAQAAGDTVVMNLDVTMTDLNVYVPLSWQVESNLGPTFGSLEIEGTSNGGGPTLIIQGRASMSDVDVKYV